jgi:hypothetical protein
MEVLTAFADITTRWIDELLDIEVGSVRSFTIRQETDFLVSRSALLDIDYREQLIPLPSALFVKIPKRDLQIEMPGIGKREVQFYTDVAPRFAASCVPRCYGAYYDMTTRWFTLVLEDLSTTHCQTEFPLPPSLAHCRMAIACLAQVHAYWWNARDLVQVTGLID